MAGNAILNYLSSHDDGGPFDPKREKPFESANKLLLSPGASQVYYGDELARSLVVEGTVGDATLRSFMNWEDIANDSTVNGYKVKDILSHWQKLGKFRRAHPAVGAGKHKMLSESPYVFSRTFSKDGYQEKVIIGLDMPKGKKSISVKSIFADDTKLKDAYSGKDLTVTKGMVEIDSEYTTVLLEKR